MNTKGAGYSDVGRCRANNEDALWFDDDLGAYAVSDGIGGHAGGERASALALDTVARVLKRAAGTLRDARAGGTSGHGPLVGLARAAVEAACHEIYTAAEADSDLHGMGCTLTLLLVAGSKGVMTHVGDTRLYLCRDGGIDQLSTDHTMAADEVRRGRMTPEAARTHEYSKCLTRSLGTRKSVHPETLIFDVLPGDVYLLCSDGLTQYVELGELGRHLARNGQVDAPRDLIALANERGGNDNITALVVRVSASEDEQASLFELREDVRRDLAVLREVELLEDLPLAHLLRIYDAAECLVCAPGQEVLAIGDPLEGLYCVLSGSFEVVTGDGEPVRLAPRAHLGGPALVVEGSSAGSLEATEPGRLLFLDGQRFRELAALRPRVGMTVLSRVFQVTLAGLDPGFAQAGLLSIRKRKSWWNPFTWARTTR